MAIAIDKAKEIKIIYNTSNPYELCDSMGISVVLGDLPQSVNGFCINIKKRNIIYINQDLCETIQKEVCAHELGHILIHPECNLLFMMDKTLFVTQKYENEADLFAAHLLIDESDINSCIEEGTSIKNISYTLGVSYNFIELYILSMSR